MSCLSSNCKVASRYVVVPQPQTLWANPQDHYAQTNQYCQLATCDLHSWSYTPWSIASLVEPIIVSTNATIHPACWLSVSPESETCCDSSICFPLILNSLETLRLTHVRHVYTTRRGRSRGISGLVEVSLSGNFILMSAESKMSAGGFVLIALTCRGKMQCDR